MKAILGDLAVGLSWVRCHRCSDDVDETIDELRVAAKNADGASVADSDGGDTVSFTPSSLLLRSGRAC